ncbi:uncharacterized protein PpBr36_09370 [Pyricularia pennisetigena]|uniref:uncharacterized protein n=1 Tax=Pyricularia pennisetigena TaxID=1578925 RepID=UPI00114D9724|nr:uncharacterized protein PpBr36_09370 [Pyricularia pennisetigena]TLS21997.1 hypothetical protein PpBr36_09370 [Pyricularia pennisetigena]
MSQLSGLQLPATSLGLFAPNPGGGSWVATSLLDLLSTIAPMYPVLFCRSLGARTTVGLAETNGFHGLIFYSAPATKERLKWSPMLLGLNRRMPRA